ncbi:hypothetical protein B0T26DRAFT_741910 [Lasiosphaeria miniovina]|uniref:Uncharacterized protein n=1 Tax=Lasiosphaeria miniovina TaxID=1954250 RepID=A0AA40DRN5_9PEZI|nr:uncharacterized protein B0T26DRAFT_741910 [Lasiosphaeria miniovina]KAK0713060.1 hypothetical protein B0T26DRAFT_741910 [Lasiosphaeria miniovina]
MPTSVESMQSCDPPTFQFTNVRDLFDAIDDAIAHTNGDSLTVTNFSPSHFTEIDRAREKQGRKFRFRDYGSNSRILIITIPTDLHEELYKRLYNEFIGQVRDMGLKDTQQGYSGRSSKEGDSTGAWPTLVIEAGFSQSLGKLRIAMQRWFSMSNHEVKIVLLPIRPGATTTRHFLQQPAPVLRQSITITRNTTTNPTSYNVTSGTLVLSFRLLFLRDPGPGEGDFVFSVQELEKYAEKVWARV